MIGRTVANFEIVEKLGSGGMGVVYRARDTVLNRPAALKFLPSHLAADEDAKARFIQEAQAASALDHANICSIYQIGETDEGELFIAMAYYDGQTLKYRLENEDFSVERALEIGAQLASGLMRAHEAGIVHRDIKPANIMVTDRGEVKLLDFGLAKLASGAQLTKSGATVGTAAYMSPEQYRGEPVGSAADVWSLGVVLYEMLTGRGPFAGDYEQAVMYSVLNAEPAPISDSRDDVPADITEFVMRCLEKDAAARPAVNELPVLSDSSAPGTPPPSSSTAGAPAGARGGSRIPKRIAGLIAAASVAVIAAAVWLLRPAPPIVDPSPRATEDGATRVAVLPFTVRGSPDFEYLGQGMVDILATKLDGAGNWRSVDPRAILGSVRDVGSPLDPRDGEVVATKVDADRFILGSIVQVGGTLQVRASLYDPSVGREPVADGSVEGPSEELFSLVDELAVQLLVGGDQAPGDRVMRLAAVTTESLPALKSYLEGEAHFRTGAYRDALDAFQSAVEIDSAFALAWYRVSAAAEWNAEGRLATDAARRALRYSARLSKHDRDLLEALAVFRQGDAERAEQMYRTIVAVYPEDVEAWFQLGEVLAHHMPLLGRPAAISREAWERVLFFEPDHLQAIWHLYRIPAAEGKIAEMDSLVDRLVELNPTGDRLVEILALQAAVHDDPVMKERALRLMKNASEGSAALAAHFVATYSGDPVEGLPLARFMTGDGHSTEQRVLGFLWSAFLEVTRGRLKAARADVAEAMILKEDAALPFKAFLDVLPFVDQDEEAILRTIAELDTWDAAGAPPAANPQSWYVVHDEFYANLRLYLLGLLSASTGQAQRTVSLIPELAVLSAPEILGSVNEDLVVSLRASVALAGAEEEQALDLLSQQNGHAWYNVLFASPFVSLSRDRFVRAELLRAAGRYDEALRLYGSFGENSVYDLIFHAPSYLARAQIYDQLGDAAMAADNYRRFIDLWADADVELQPRVDGARERLAALDSESGR